MNYAKTLPLGTFLERYCTASETIETPYIYDYFTALWALSASLGRSIKINRPMAPVYMNMYLMLVSESGRTRKSTAIKLAVDVVRPVLDLSSPKSLVIESKITGPNLISMLSKHTRETGAANGVLVASELAAMMSRQNHGIVITLTDLYDCPQTRIGTSGIARENSVKLNDVCLSFIGGSTLTWLTQSVTPVVIEGGFTSRCYFVAAEKPKRSEAWPEERAMIDRARLTDKLHEIRERSTQVGEITVSKPAIGAFTAWYKGRRSFVDPYRRSFAAREDAHVLRLAGLLAVNRDAWDIKEDQIATAIRLVTHIRKTGASFFTEEQKVDPETQLARRIKTMLLQAGNDGLLRSRITLGTSHIASAQAVSTMLDVMHELHMIDMFDLSTVNKRGTIVRATPKLRKNNIEREIVTNITDDDTLDLSSLLDGSEDGDRFGNIDLV